MGTVKNTKSAGQRQNSGEVMMKTVSTVDELHANWADVVNFRMAGECVPLRYDFPPVETIVDRLRQDDAAKIRSGIPGNSLDISSTIEGFTELPIEEAMKRPFGLAHFSLSRFYGNGDILEGFEEQVMVRWRQFMADAGFTWHRCNPIIFISGPRCATNYHFDRSTVIAWQITGTKKFCGLRDPDRWLPVPPMAEHGPAEPGAISKPPGITEADVLACTMSPGDVLWNVILTPHWVEAGESVAMSVNLSHGGLRHRGTLCRNDAYLHQWYAKNPSSFL